jgi:hypothetical protein
MMATEVEYELEERAAIRQFDGGQGQAAAESLAGGDMAGRDEEIARVQTIRAEGDIDSLEKERDKVRRAWLATNEPEENLRLKKRWQELCMQIVHAKEKEGLI